MSGHLFFVSILSFIVGIGATAWAAPYKLVADGTRTEWKQHHEQFFATLAATKPVTTASQNVANPKVTVVAVLGTSCPLTRRYLPRLNEIAKEYAKDGVRFVGIFPQSADKAEVVREFAKKMNIVFETYEDADSKMLNHLFLTRVPDVLVFDKGNYLAYRGLVDDQYRIDGALPQPKNAYLKTTLEQLSDGKPLTQEPTLSPGCIITPKQGARVSHDFTNSIGPMIFKNCAYCHKSGEIADFLPLTTHSEVVDALDTVEERVRSRYMPPWRADHRYGTFQNDMSLDTQQIHALMEWNRAKHPAGAKPPAYPVTAPSTSTASNPNYDWRMGKPDAVFTIGDEGASNEDPKGFKVPAEGVLSYQHVRVKTNFEEDRWVTASEVRPTSPGVVHHANVFVVSEHPTDYIVDRPLAFMIAARIANKRFGVSSKELKWTFKLYGQHMERRLHLIGSFNPMLTARSYPEGYGFLLPAGAELIFELHYTPNGTPGYDRTGLALKFGPKVPEGEDRKEVYTRGSSLMRQIQIPPHSKFEYTHTTPFFADAQLLSARPHMHNRGRSATMVVEDVKGVKHTILEVPKYDYEWQVNYEFNPPIELEKGSKLHVTYRWDNTVDNPKNPAPEDHVRFGLQIADEMGMAFPTYVYKRPSEAALAEEESEEAVRQLAIEQSAGIPDPPAR